MSEEARLFGKSRAFSVAAPWLPPPKPCLEREKNRFFRIFPPFLPCFPVEKWPTLFLIIAIRVAD